MRTLKWMACLAVLGLVVSSRPAAAQPGDRPGGTGLAVLPFTASSTAQHAGGLGVDISDSLLDALAQSPEARRMGLFERTRLKSVLAELKLSETGLFDAENAPRIGKLASVRYVLMGRVTTAQTSKAENILDDVIKNLPFLKKNRTKTTLTRSEIALEARVVDVNSGRVIRAFSADGSAVQAMADFKKASQDAVKNLCKKVVKAISTDGTIIVDEGPIVDPPPTGKTNGSKPVVPAPASAIPARILKADRDDEFYIDAGTDHGLEKGRRYQLMHVEELDGGIRVPEPVAEVEVLFTSANGAKIRVLEVTSKTWSPAKGAAVEFGKPAPAGGK